MNGDKEKLDILKRNNYKYMFDRELYFNREARKIFSREAIEDHDVKLLKDRIEEENVSEVMIYFNGPVSEEIVEELKQVFNL